MKSNKAQANQIFTWIIAIVMLSLVILFGYKAISNMQSKGEQVKYLEFKNDLESTISSTKDYGSERVVTLRIPIAYKQVCFLNTVGSLPTADIIDDPIIRDSVESQTINGVLNENVFLITDIADKSFLIENIKIEDNNGYLCAEVDNGKVKIRIEGFGRYARVSLA